MRHSIVAACAVLVSLSAAPVMAHDGRHAGAHPGSYGGPYADGPPPAHYQPPARYQPYAPAARDAWLADCRERLSSRDSGVGGAVVGGVVGAVAGNRIAGRRHRTVGTLAGAAVGAVAGAAIDRAEDDQPARDECEAYLDDYYAAYTQGGYPGGPMPYYGYGYPAAYYPAYAVVPVVQAGCCAPPRAEPECTETVEYVTEYVPAPRRRAIPPRRVKAVPDKRTKLVPIK